MPRHIRSQEYTGPTLTQGSNGRMCCATCGRPRRRNYYVLSRAIKADFRTIVRPHHFHIQRLIPLGRYGDGKRKAWKTVQKFPRLPETKVKRGSYKVFGNAINCAEFDFWQSQVAIRTMHRRCNVYFHEKTQESERVALRTTRAVLTVLDEPASFIKINDHIACAEASVEFSCP